MVNKKYLAIEFKEFNFPSWEEFSHRTKSGTVGHYYIEIKKDKYAALDKILTTGQIFACFYSPVECTRRRIYCSEYFGYTEQGYTLACKQLNDWSEEGK